MKKFDKLLVPTDLSDPSRRGLHYAFSLAADEKAEIVVLHVANEFQAWELFADDFGWAGDPRAWPTDRVLAEASLDLHRFLERDFRLMKNVYRLSKRVVLGPIASQIAFIAEQERADLIILSPRRKRTLKHFLAGSITEQVTRMSGCPVLSVTSPMPSRKWQRGRFRLSFRLSDGLAIP